MNPSTAMDIEEIRRYLPHRYPFLLIDRITEVEIGSHIKAIKNVTANEPFFQGHFPGKAVMPGSDSDAFGHHMGRFGTGQGGDDARVMSFLACV